MVNRNRKPECSGCVCGVVWYASVVLVQMYVCVCMSVVVVVFDAGKLTVDMEITISTLHLAHQSAHATFHGITVHVPCADDRPHTHRLL